ncbi:MAG: hypothetical protein M3N43_03255 [Actinomycetota bacterium]|nr:hypothetical protein [Actinomycetota bacterium]
MAEAKTDKLSTDLAAARKRAAQAMATYTAEAEKVRKLRDQLEEAESKKGLNTDG